MYLTFCIERLKLYVDSLQKSCIRKLGPIKWDADFKEKLDKVLENTALTAEFGFKNNTLVYRSKYKVRFESNSYCYNVYNNN